MGYGNVQTTYYIVNGDTVSPLTAEEMCDLMCGKPEFDDESDWEDEEDDDYGECW